MKEQPILFSGPMVRAILDGSKTQTRRIVKWQPSDGWFFDGRFGIVTSPHPKRGKFGAFIRKEADKGFPQADLVPCPYGQPGDRLWVREAWRVAQCYDGYTGKQLEQKLSARNVQYEARGDKFLGPVEGRYRHARFMPRWASRITLEVVNVRIERLQDISEDDAFYEGVTMPSPCSYTYDECPWRTKFRELWESINGEGSWDLNPHVWVVEFKKLEGGAS